MTNEALALKQEDLSEDTESEESKQWRREKQDAEEQSLQKIHGRRHSRTVSNKSIRKRDLALGRELYPDDPDFPRPKTRAECKDGPRPCPFVSCKYHLYLDVIERTGSITFNYPDKEVDELEESCALDVADRGGVTLEEVGALMRVSRERIRQIESKALPRLRRLPVLQEIRNSGGIDGGEGADDDTLDADTDRGGGGAPDSDPDPDQEWSDRIWNMYERTSRERQLGIRTEYVPTPKHLALVLVPKEEVSSEPVSPNDPEPGPPVVAEEPMTNKKVTTLTEKEKLIYDTYVAMADNLGAKPSPRDVALKTGLNIVPNQMSATVCNALSRVQAKGFVVPYFGQKAPRPKTADKSSKTARAPRPKKVRAPKPVKVKKTPAPKVSPNDPFSGTLLERREFLLDEMAALQKQLDAVNVLLETMR